MAPEPGRSDGESARILKTVSRWHARVQGVLLCFGSLGGGALAWLVLGLLRPIADERRHDGQTLNATAVWLLEHRTALLWPALAACACGVLMLRRRRGRWLWFLAGALLTMAVFGAALYAFLMIVGPLYDVDTWM